MAEQIPVATAADTEDGRLTSKRGRARYRRHRHLRMDESAFGRHALGGVGITEDLLHYLVSAFLVIVGAVVLANTLVNFITQHDQFAERVTNAVNGVLFVIIIMEILRTVLAHFDDAGLQLKPFLIIGIISAVRHILTVGAQASLGVHESGEGFRQIRPRSSWR